MKFRFGAYACMMFGLAAVMTACGGGGGGGGGGVVVPIPVTASKNPQLNGTAITINADFTNYTSTARFGANAAKVGNTVNFAVTPTTTPPATLTNQTTIMANNKATVDVTGQSNTYTVTATLNAASGSKAVTFIPQPGSATVQVKSPALMGLGVIQCGVTNDLPVIFSNFSSIKPAGSITSTNPATGPGSIVGPVTLAIVGGSAFNVAQNTTLFTLSYNIASGVPNFALDADPLNQIAQTFGPPPADITPFPALTVQEAFFSGPDGTGTKLYQSP
jgi:hypothetical protein